MEGGARSGRWSSGDKTAAAAEISGVRGAEVNNRLHGFSLALLLLSECGEND